jgi:hypothetical protein
MSWGRVARRGLPRRTVRRVSMASNPNSAAPGDWGDSTQRPGAGLLHRLPPHRVRLAPHPARVHDEADASLVWLDFHTAPRGP